MKNPSVFIVVLCFTILATALASIAATGLQGHFRCGFTDYMWPTSPEDAPTATGNGTMEFESDGNGKFTAGSMSEHQADDTRTFGEKACTFQLVSGEYHLSTPSAGTSTLAWKLQPGGDSHCGAALRNAPNIGFTESARDYAIFSGTGNFFISQDGGSKWISASAIGVSIGSCSQVH
ncbi:MAG: hypothetical protein ACLQDV_27630 [Candidatus Binataceae bacterium]